MPRYRYRRAKRPKRKIYRSRGFWFFFLFLIIIGVSTYFVFFSDLLRVKNIEVSGTGKVSADEVKSIFLTEISKKMLFFLPKNILSVDFDKLSNDVSSKFPEIEKVSVKIVLPNTVSAEIIEKTPEGCWCAYSECYYFDKYGVVYQKNSNCNNLLTINSDKKPELTKQIISENELNNVSKIFKDVSGLVKIKNLNFYDEKIILETNQGWKIYFKHGDDIPGQIVNLKAILEQKVPVEKQDNLNYIDLRFGNKVFYKFK